MKKIALEEHFITPDFLPLTEQVDFVAMNQVNRADFKARLLDFHDMRLKEMDKAGIELAVLSLTDPGVQGEKDAVKATKLASTVNDFLAERVAENPQRFRGFAQIALQNPKEAVKELERAVLDLHFVGVLVNGQTNGHYLDEEQFYPLWEKLEELKVPLYLHPGSPYQSAQSYNGHPELNGPFWGWTAETATHALRLITSATFDHFPSAKVILGHMGETLPYLAWRFDSRWKILQHSKQLKKQPSQYLRDNICVTTSGMCSNGSLLCAIHEIGEDNVLFSVDYPYESSAIASEFIQKAPLSDIQREKVAYKNAARILQLSL